MGLTWNSLERGNEGVQWEQRERGIELGKKREREGESRAHTASKFWEITLTKNARLWEA